MVANLVSGSTAHGKNGKSAVENLRNHLGETVEVKVNGENFAGELTNVEERILEGTVVGARFTVKKRKFGGEVTLSTFFKDDDFSDGDFVRPF